MEMTLQSSPTLLPPRVAADVDRVDLTRAKSARFELRFSPAVWEQELFLVIDIYSAVNRVHPDGHAGWWKWPLAEREDVTVQIAKSGSKLDLRFNGQPAPELWVNDEYDAASEPALAMHVVLRRTLSSSICFDDQLLVLNDKAVLAAIDQRRNEFIRVPEQPVSSPWYLWPREATVRLAAANIFERDAVGNYALAVYRLLRANGIPAQLYAGNFEPSMRGAIRYIGDLLDDVEEQDLVWMNFSIFDPYLPAIANLDCRKLLYFHNITPPRYFQIYDAEYSVFCANGLAQLAEADKFGVLLANSATSAGLVKETFAAEREKRLAAAKEAAAQEQSSLPRPAGASAAKRKLLGSPAALAAESKEAPAKKRARKVQAAVCPPILGGRRWESIAGEPIDLPDAQSLLLYVGRVAPHKRVEDLLALFAKFHALDRQSALLIVGGMTFAGYTGYLQYLLDHDYAAIKSRIHFLNGVSDGQLKTIYSSASAFVTMSEHEGYCVPLVEAMEFGLPVFAYADPAMSETLGQAGRRFHDKDFSQIAADIRHTLQTPWKRDAMIAAQQARLAELMTQADGRPIWTALEKAMFSRARSI